MTNQDDKELIERIVNSNDKEKSFSLIFRRYANFVYDLGRTLGIPRSDIDDFVQEVFIKLYEKINKFNTNKEFFPWFYSLVRNYAYDFIKRIRKRKDSDFKIPEHITNPYESDIQTINEVRDIISKIPEKEREVLFLRYYQDLEVDEIAKILNCSPRNVYNIIDKALKKIKKEFT